ncbi:MAG TPA: hypothetical protein VGJ55_15790 [Pyrinomonadaceae bacterium]
MKYRIIRLTLVLIVITGSFSVAVAQGFPYGDFERRTLQELVKINQQEDSEDLKRFPDQNQFVFRGKTLPSVVRLTYTGESRPLGSERKKFIELWASSYYRNRGYANLYEAEFLFKEGIAEYWLPVQKQVAKYFDGELKKGEPVDLYLILPGGLRAKGKIDWILLVEEFQQPGD